MLSISETSQLLGKRRAQSTLHSFTITSADSRSQATPIIINGKLQPQTKKRYQCTFQGCDKAYTKPSRLAEHERSHTGERPYHCETCNKNFLRETHLHAHVRSHLPESSRPFLCEKPGCPKRFWTSQHLKVHIGWHEGAKPFSCPEDDCAESFSKHHQLRSHIANAHSPPGTKPYRCEHPTCSKSFPTNPKLRAHLKTHDDKRYTCVHPDCITGAGQGPKYFPTWSALQVHIRNDHPPTCTHPSCGNRVFASQKGLRAHMKLHEQRDEALEQQSEDDDDNRPTKKRRGGDWGRDWVCDFEGCSKDFKSKKALNVHKNVRHLGQRNFVCPHEGCAKTYGYKHLLQRHMSKSHHVLDDFSDTSIPSIEDEDDVPQTSCTGSLDIDFITGHAYATKAQAKIAERRALQCPYPNLQPFVAEDSEQTRSQTPLDSHTHQPCDYAFRRAYDLRRHLRGTHGYAAQKESVELWVAQQKLAWYM